MPVRVTPAMCCLALVWLVAPTGCKRAKETHVNSPARTANHFIVDVMTVAPQPLQDTLTTTGTLHAREAITLQSEIAGVVKEIHFKESEPVAAGTVLVTIDDSELQAQLASASAELELRTALERRQSELRTARAISEAEYDESLANLHLAEASRQRVEAMLAKTQIRAPFAGVPGLRQVSPGAYLSPGTAIAQFRDIRALKLDFSVPERYLPHLRTGTPVKFRVAGHLEPFTATLVAIEPGIDPATRSVLMRAELSNDKGTLLPGAFAEVEVPLREIAEAILIPPIALVPGLKEQHVFVFKDGRAEEREVKIGLRNAASVQVTEGLQPGEELITSGVLQLRSGLPVQARRRGERAPEPAKPAAPDVEPTSS